jgi:methionine synthase II (cobalamin-independent)
MKKPLAKLALYHYIHKKNKVLIPLVDQQIRDLSETDELKSLINQAENYVITQHMSASHN